MAKIYEKENSIQAESTKYRNKAVIIGLIGVFFLILSHIVVSKLEMRLFFLSPMSGFSGILLLSYAGINWRKYQQLNSGVKGKRQTLSFASTLPDSYSVITNPNITYQGQTSMLDTVVVGPNGVFIIQTKIIPQRM